ncbi:hypothetical protein EYR36_011809 [Pleurotus pulmonarius]|nr:hypothetical protein EYR36_011809 [Pleurotus pulmonarius]KAF4607306.1 hypothetical protein EYR38_001367 [Pleurotus pulmonarius]
MAPNPQCAALAAAKARKGLSYGEIASQLNKPEQHVIDVCTGKVPPTSAEFDALARVLGITGPTPDKQYQAIHHAEVFINAVRLRMRFSAPRSISPSPTRASKRRTLKQRRRSSTFGLQSDSDDSDYDSDRSYASEVSESSVASSSSSGSFMYKSELEEQTQPRPSATRNSLSSSERRYIDETISAIRLRTRHHDPYEEWEKDTRRDAFLSARKEQTQIQHQLSEKQERLRLRQAQQIAELHARQVDDVARKLRDLQLHQQSEERRLKEVWDHRAKQQWQRIEGVIKQEEDKLKAKLEAQRKVREEEEKRQREAELKRRLLEEKKRQEEEAKKREEEESRRKQEETRRQRQEEDQRLLKEQQEKAARTKAEQDQRQALGVSTALEDWREARRALHQLKTAATRPVKSDKAVKSAWSALRRQITPKIGQLTNDDQTISRIASQIFGLLMPNPPLPQPVYFSALSSLSKAILLQAETEVTAEKRAAIPLARVTRHLLSALPSFHFIFLAKLVQRVGSWSIPIVIPPLDFDDKPWSDDAARSKAMGYRTNGGEAFETNSEYGIRVSGIMRVFFQILAIPVSQTDKPLPPSFQLPRFWIWFARMMSEPSLLVSAVAPQVLFVALDVLGAEAKALWGMQWVKVLGLLYEGVTTGLGNGKFIGGDSPEGKAARVRVQLEVERLMGGQ